MDHVTAVKHNMDHDSVRGSCDLSQGIHNIVMCNDHSVLAWYDDIIGHTPYITY